MSVCQIGRLEEGKSQGISPPFPLGFFFFFGISSNSSVFSAASIPIYPTFKDPRPRLDQ